MPWFMISGAAAAGESDQGCGPAEIQRLNKVAWSRGQVPSQGMLP